MHKVALSSQEGTWISRKNQAWNRLSFTTGWEDRSSTERFHGCLVGSYWRILHDYLSHLRDTFKTGRKWNAIYAWVDEIINFLDWIKNYSRAKNNVVVVELTRFLISAAFFPSFSILFKFPPKNQFYPWFFVKKKKEKKNVKRYSFVRYSWRKFFSYARINRFIEWFIRWHHHRRRPRCRRRRVQPLPVAKERLDSLWPPCM